MDCSFLKSHRCSKMPTDVPFVCKNLTNKKHDTQELLYTGGKGGGALFWNVFL